MTEVRFYHLTRTSLDRALPQMLEKVIERGKRAVVVLGSPERVEAMADHLWSYDDRGFLPHGSAKDGHAEDQPIWITDKDENPNGAQYLFLADGATSEKTASFEMVADLFDGGDQDAMAAARSRWTAVREAGHEAQYFQQNESGGWTKKA